MDTVLIKKIQVHNFRNLSNDIIEFSDVLFLSLAIPNIIGGVLLAPKVKEVLKKYQEEFKL